MLEGIKVVDISHHLAGPFSGQRLGDLGADVIKVEPPGGEWSRQEIRGQKMRGMSTSFHSVNRNKRGIVIDIKNPDGLAVLDRLVADADVFIVNMRPTTVARLGVDFDRLHRLNPRLVYVSVTGYGESGPSAPRRGQDLLVQAYSGITWNQGRASDPPAPIGVPVVDVATSYLATIGVLTALFERERTGIGQHVEVDLLSTAIDMQLTELMGYLNNGLISPRWETISGSPTAPAPYGIHRTKDGFVAIAFGDYGALADALGDERIRTFHGWMDGYERGDELYEIIRPRLLERTTAEWIEILDAHDIWCGPVNDYPALVADPQIADRGIIATGPDDGKGAARYLRLPIRFSAFEPKVYRHPPALGQDTDQVLHEIGCDESEISALHASGAVA